MKKIRHVMITVIALSISGCALTTLGTSKTQFSRQPSIENIDISDCNNIDMSLNTIEGGLQWIDQQMVIKRLSNTGAIIFGILMPLDNLIPNHGLGKLDFSDALDKRKQEMENRYQEIMNERQKMQCNAYIKKPTAYDIEDQIEKNKNQKETLNKLLGTAQ